MQKRMVNFLYAWLTLGYSFMLVDANKYEVARERNPAWCKLAAVAEALDRHPSMEWVWWLDLDAIIMSPHVDLYEHLLGPTALAGRLLKGETIKQDDKLRPDGKPLPNLQTGEVYLNYKHELT
jgi:hypothetical protein